MAEATLPAGHLATRLFRMSESSRIRYPSDAELTLAISAAAKRDAEARAEACFAHRYTQTKDWRTVR